MTKRSSSTPLVPTAAPGATCSTCASHVSFAVPLTLVSAKNSKIQNTRVRATFKNPQVVAFERDFARLVPREACRHLGSLTEPLRSIVTVYYPSRRQDLDCALLYDCLQTAGVIANDRYLIEHHEYAEVDARNPRIEVTIEEL